MKLKKNDTITVLGRRWFEKTNGNTYHSVQVYINGNEIGYEPFTYGYESQYLQTAVKLLNEKLDTKIEFPLWKLKEKGINLIENVVDVPRKKDL